MASQVLINYFDATECRGTPTDFLRVVMKVRLSGA